jgi:hypothetical protein
MGTAGWKAKSKKRNGTAVLLCFANEMETFLYTTMLQ